MPCRRFAVVSGFLLAVGMIGCAAGNSPVPVSPVVSSTASNLSGNWLVAGALPVSAGSTFGSTQTLPPFGIAITLDVSGNQVTGEAYASESCTNNNGTLSTLPIATLAGTVAKDGSFTLEPPVLSGLSPQTLIVLQGNAPATPGMPWTGSYSFSGVCGTTLTGPIQAVPLPLLHGTYSATITPTVNTGSTSTSGTGSPVAISFTLQQGGTATNPTNGAQGPFTNHLLTGTVTIQGPSCQLTGTTTGATTLLGTPIVSDVIGDTVGATFLMSDGSTLNLFGNVANTGGTQLSFQWFPLPNPSSTNTCSPPFELQPTIFTLQ